MSRFMQFFNPSSTEDLLLLGGVPAEFESTCQQLCAAGRARRLDVDLRLEESLTSERPNILITLFCESSAVGFHANNRGLPAATIPINWFRSSRRSVYLFAYSCNSFEHLTNLGMRGDLVHALAYDGDLWMWLEGDMPRFWSRFLERAHCELRSLGRIDERALSAVQRMYSDWILPRRGFRGIMRNRRKLDYLALISLENQLTILKFL